MVLNKINHDLSTTNYQSIGTKLYKSILEYHNPSIAIT